MMKNARVMLLWLWKVKTASKLTIFLIWSHCGCWKLAIWSWKPSKWLLQSIKCDLNSLWKDTQWGLYWDWFIKLPFPWKRMNLGHHFKVCHHFHSKLNAWPFTLLALLCLFLGCCLVLLKINLMNTILWPTGMMAKEQRAWFWKPKESFNDHAVHVCYKHMI